MANVVASNLRQAPLDHELLNIGEPLRPLEFRTRPLHVMSRWRPIWRRNLVALQERHPAPAAQPCATTDPLGWSNAAPLPHKPGRSSRPVASPRTRLARS